MEVGASFTERYVSLSFGRQCQLHLRFLEALCFLKLGFGAMLKEVDISYTWCCIDFRRVVSRGSKASEGGAVKVRSRNTQPVDAYSLSMTDKA